MSNTDWRDTLASIKPVTDKAQAEVDNIVNNENKEKRNMNNNQNEAVVVVEATSIITVGDEVLTETEVSEDNVSVEVVSKEEIEREKQLGSKLKDFRSLKEIIHELFASLNMKLSEASYLFISGKNLHCKVDGEGIFSISLEKYNIPGLSLKGKEINSFYLTEAGRRIAGKESIVNIHVLIRDTLYVLFEGKFHPIKLTGVKQVTPEYLLDVAHEFIYAPKPKENDPLDDII